MEKQLKKSAIDLTELAIGILILGMIVGIGSTILLTVRDSRLTSLPTVTTANESSVAVVNETGVQLANTWVSSVIACTNKTGYVIPTANYTTSISSLDGMVTIANTGLGSTAAGLNNTLWNCTYNWYNTSQADWKLANESAIGIGEYGNWFKIIVIVGVAALVLGLIFLSFGRKGEGESVGISY